MIERVSAPALESLVADIVRRLSGRALESPLSEVRRVEVHAQALELQLPVGWLTAARDRLVEGETAERHEVDPQIMRVTIPVRMQMRGGRATIHAGPRQVRRDPVLIRGLRLAHRLAGAGSPAPEIDVAPETPYQRRMVRLAFLAPDIQRAIVEGEQPGWLNVERLSRGEIPLSWEAQRRMFGLKGS